MFNLLEANNTIRVEMAEDLMRKAEQSLDKKYGDGFSKDNPKMLLKYAIFIALCGTYPLLREFEE